MALRFVMSGGNFIFSAGPSAAGIWGSVGNNVSIVSNAPLGRANQYAFQSSPAFGSSILRTPFLGTFSSMIAGMAVYIPSVMQNNTVLISFLDAFANSQCDVRYTATGVLYFTRNGTAISALSSFALSPDTWVYVEFKALFSLSAAGTCEVRLNSVPILTASGVMNCTSTATGSVAQYSAGNSTATGWNTDFYALDTSTGANVGYLGDIDVVELYPNGPGVNSAWADNPAASFSITSVANASGGNTVYTGTITGGASNAYVGYNFVPSGFANSANNGTFKCVASTATTITLNNPSGVTDTTGSMPFQCIVQTGAINQAGTRPNGDVAYISDATTNDISDFAHTPLILTGVVLGIGHFSYLRKDDMGIREVAQVCLSGASTEQGATISLGNVFQYWVDILEVDPHTSTQFSVSALNAATLGIKELT
jgi:hypothetical protein